MYSGAYIVYCMLVYYFSVQSRTIYTFGARSFAQAVETSKITFYLPVSSLHHMKDENFRLVSPIDSDMNMHNHKVGPLPAISRGGVIAYNFFFRGYKPSYPSIRPFEGRVTYNPVVLMAHLVDLSTLRLSRRRTARGDIRYDYLEQGPGPQVNSIRSGKAICSAEIHGR